MARMVRDDGDKTGGAVIAGAQQFRDRGDGAVAQTLGQENSQQEHGDNRAPVVPGSAQTAAVGISHCAHHCVSADVGGCHAETGLNLAQGVICHQKVFRGFGLLGGSPADVEDCDKDK